MANTCKLKLPPYLIREKITPKPSQFMTSLQHMIGSKNIKRESSLYLVPTSHNLVGIVWSIFVDGIHHYLKVTKYLAEKL